ncbi:ArsR family transcriptional regulator [Peribacillus cavernae]|uniref:ArsR family transcriptional regulator n=1 Tax=Peribacillus cavernae TaxID=1674310 RepID=A0A433HRR7_9BACI|nr:ArsR family transcriptional regulator [Peribacillus cavernae]MDQ0218777.1 DNA-binding transcriptional ArsR family regulator [Peribacillus cavernae]RUQ30988.1 ArsR family transcriptional regulator [Peribacillus cavernae]
MKHLYSPQPIETISLEVESSPVWEVILGIAGYTHTQLRHTFDLDEKWTTEQSSMPGSLVNHLKVIEKTNFWYGLIMLQNKLSASSVRNFSNLLSEMPIDYFYDILLPYKDRDTEAMRKTTATQCDRLELFEQYAAYFDTHDYLGEYVRGLGHYSYQDICDLFNYTMDEWYNWVSQHEEWDKWTRALAFEQKQYSSLDMTNPTEEIERITGGIKYRPEPSVWTVKLIPHISYRPWILEKRTPDTKLFFYPLKEEYLMEPGIPSKELVRGHKALGDELRLKLLYQLLKGPSSLQEMSVQFNTSKTTLHHQLSLLKAAKFIRVDKGIYSANLTQINSFSGQLTQYLGDHI